MFVRVVHFGTILTERVARILGKGRLEQTYAMASASVLVGIAETPGSSSTDGVKMVDSPRLAALEQMSHAGRVFVDLSLDGLWYISDTLTTVRPPPLRSGPPRALALLPNLKGIGQIDGFSGCLRGCVVLALARHACL